LKLLLIVGIIDLVAGHASALPFSSNVVGDVYGVAQGGVVNGIPTARDDNGSLPDINDAINLIQGTSLAHNADADPLFIEPDYVWNGISGLVILIGLTAEHSNTLGYYTDLGTGMTQTPILGPYSGYGFVGDGTAGNPFPAATMALGTGTDFGWFLSSNGTDYFSEPALNPAGFDHLMTFELPEADGRMIYVDTGSGATAVTLNNPLLVTWEDMGFDGSTLGDDDFDDMIFLVDRVDPVPEPATLWLILIAALCLIRFRRSAC
jgi:hypothetical protein